MIKSLRNRFIIITMCIFTCVLIGVFAALYISMSRSVVNSAMMSLQKVAEKDGEIQAGDDGLNFGISDKFDRFDAILPGKDHGAMPLPGETAPGNQNEWFKSIDTISVKFDKNFMIFDIITALGTAHDVDDLNDTQLIDLIKSGKKTGTAAINDVSYRYYITEREYGGILVLASRTWEIDTMNRLVWLSLIIGILSMIVLFFISIFLARWVIIPVEAAWRKQQQFVADASHELKTPLTVISANLDVISENGDETAPEQQKWYGNIKAETECMKNLINELLALAKMDSCLPGGKKVRSKEMAFKRFSLSDTLRNVCLSFESVFYESGKKFSDCIDEDITLKGDENSLRRLAVILMDNALKNAGENGKVSLSLHRDRNEAVITCTNTGPGIPKEHIGRIFERFYRVDTSRNRETGGFGLGLSIAKSIAEYHGGSISAQSEPGVMTIFTVRLPL